MLETIEIYFERLDQLEFSSTLLIVLTAKLVETVDNEMTFDGLAT